MRTVLTSLVFAALATAALAHGSFDLSPYVDGDKIQIGGVTHGTDENPLTEAPAPAGTKFWVPQWLVYPLELGEGGIYGPNGVGHPGINHEAGTYRDPYTDLDSITLTGTGLNPSSQLDFTVTRDALVWNNAADAFDAITTGERVRFTLGINNVTSYASGTTAQNLWVPFSSGDELHSHLITQLLDSSNGNSPAVGVYLVEGQITTNQAGIADSDPFYMVLNYGADEAVHEAAIHHVEDHMIPEPASMALLGLGAVAVRRRAMR